MDRVWTVQPHAEAFLQGQLALALARTPDAARYAEALRSGCGVRLRDILDHMGGDAAFIAAATAVGWQAEVGVHENRDGFFPGIIASSGALRIAFRVESLDRFLAATGIAATVEGPAHGPLRMAVVFRGDGTKFVAVERNGAIGYTIEPVSDASIRAARLHLQAFRTRRRRFDTVEQGLAHTETLVDAAVTDIGQHRACDIWLRAEREYWMTRCPAGARW